MNYKGKLYGRIGNNTYFDTAYTTDDWDAMEAKIKEIEKVKRKPLPDGTLELTSEELDEINNLMKGEKVWHAHDGEISGGHRIIKINYIDNYIFCKYSGYIENFASKRKVSDVKAIAYLLERFDLSSNN